MKDRAIEAIQKINAILEEIDAPETDGLTSGKSGLALYYFYLAKVFPNPSYQEKAFSLLEDIFEKVQSNTAELAGYSLSTGATGLCLMLNILCQDDMLEMDLESDLAPFHDYIFEESVKDIKNGQLDFLHQGLGAVYYFSTLPQSAATKKNLEILVDEIYEKGISDDLNFRLINSYGGGAGKKYDLSISHGLSGALLVLLKIHQLGIRQNKTKEMIQKGIHFILDFYKKTDQNKTGDSSLFPLVVRIDNNAAQYSKMLAWCYGDLNQLYLLLEASKVFSEEDWKPIIDDLSEKVSTRTFADGLVKNSHFCHGAAGISQVFKELNKIAPNAIYQSAHEKWMEHTLDSFKEDLDNKLYEGREAELLEGMIGVGMALLSYISKEDLKWMNAFMM